MNGFQKKISLIENYNDNLSHLSSKLYSFMKYGLAWIAHLYTQFICATEEEDIFFLQKKIIKRQLLRRYLGLSVSTIVINGFHELRRWKFRL